MRTARIVAALAFTTAPALAQAPAGPTAPANAKPASSSWELRVGASTMSAERNADFNNRVTSSTGSVRGVDVLLRGRIGGIAFRSLSSDFEPGVPNVTSADARLLIGGQIFSVHVGAGRRALWSDLGTNTFDLGLAGFSSTIRIGGTGVRAHIGATVFVPAGEAQDKANGGLEGETSLIYTLPKVPLFVQLGYRTELFTAKAGLSPNQIDAPEEVRGIRLGAGLQLGGR